MNEYIQAYAWILMPFAAGVATGIFAMAMAVGMTRRDEEEMNCEDCEVVEMCRKMFGRYWEDKSSGGKGCRHPVGRPAEEDFKVRDRPQATPRRTAASARRACASGAKYTQEELI